jgi:hypothetical protein
MQARLKAGWITEADLAAISAPPELPAVAPEDAAAGMA